ncbi:MAG: hypothetical protein LBO04_07980 [Spirochaetaceae bacterium]|jgi:transposase-like protein|nr:hypothetical protein [Spirochaetaceae bacterium]
MSGVVRYSGAFKLRLVDDAAAGKYQNLDEARHMNGIRGGSTLSKRVKKYGREDIPPKRVKAGTMNEIDELKAARKRIREPGAALAGAHMGYCLESAFPGIARGRAGRRPPMKG